MKKNIPNILSALRLLMVPVVVYMFGIRCRVGAFAVFAAASLTDVADGYLARKNNWITDLGKVLDPLADKLLQFATAVCLALENKVFWIVAALIFLKELTMAVGSLIVLRRRRIQVVSMWYGKAATAIYFAVVSIFILFPDIAPFDLILSVFLCVMMTATLMLYYFNAYKCVYGMSDKQ